ncbi:MAG TPA: hypothetical protein VFG47_04500 [Geminicoccaceae bacterium]|nr:hypothetical protein [Geminicoccaceae bacterium]
MTRTVLARLSATLAQRPVPRRHLPLAAAAGLLALALGVPTVVAVAQGRSSEALPAAAQEALAKRLGDKLVFAIAVGDNGQIEPAPGQDVVVRDLEPGYRPPQDRILEEFTITVIKYEKNSHCYIYYQAGVPKEYCPVH